MLRAIGWLCCLAAVAGGVASCGPVPSRRAAGGNPAWALLDQPPGDFTLSVTVYAPDASAAQVSPLPRYLRSLRAIVQPDLSLRVAEGPSTPRRYPSLTRTLSPEQYRALWRDLRDSGLLQERRPDEVDSADAAAPATDDVPTRGLYIISYVAAERHRTLAIDPLLGEDAPGARRLVDRLAALGWIE